MEYPLQSMYNHMVGRAASFVSPFYSILLERNTLTFDFTSPTHKCFFFNLKGVISKIMLDFCMRMCTSWFAMLNNAFIIFLVLLVLCMYRACVVWLNNRFTFPSSLNIFLKLNKITFFHFCHKIC